MDLKTLRNFTHEERLVIGRAVSYAMPEIKETDHEGIFAAIKAASPRTVGGWCLRYARAMHLPDSDSPGFNAFFNGGPSQETAEVAVRMEHTDALLIATALMG